MAAVPLSTTILRMRSLRGLTITAPTGAVSSHTYISVANGGASPVSVCARSNSMRLRADRRPSSPSKLKITLAAASSCSMADTSPSRGTASASHENSTSPSVCGARSTCLRSRDAEPSASACTATAPSFCAHRYCVWRLPGRATTCQPRRSAGAPVSRPASGVAHPTNPDTPANSAARRVTAPINEKGRLAAASAWSRSRPSVRNDGARPVPGCWSRRRPRS